MNSTEKKQCVKQIDIQEIKNSVESWWNHLNEAEDRISDLEDRITASNHKGKNF